MNSISHQPASVEPANESFEKLLFKKNQFHQKITSLIKTQQEYFNEFRYENLSSLMRIKNSYKKLSLCIHEGAKETHFLTEEELLAYVKYLCFQWKYQFYDGLLKICWQKYKENFNANSYHIESLLELTQKIQNDIKLMANFTTPKIQLGNVQIEAVEKRSLNKSKIFIIDNNQKMASISPFFDFEDNDLATKMNHSLISNYNKIVVKIKNKNLPFYDLKSLDEEISEENTNLMFDEEELNQIPQEERELLLQYIKPYMFTPPDIRLIMIYGKEGEQHAWETQRSVGIIPLKYSEQNCDKMCFCLLEKTEFYQEQRLLPMLKVQAKLARVASKIIFNEKEKLNLLSSLIESYFQSLLSVEELKGKEVSHQSSNDFAMVANLTEGSSENCKKEVMQQIATVGKKKKSKKQKSKKPPNEKDYKHNFAIRKQTLPSTHLPKLSFPLSDLEVYRQARVLIGLEKGKLNWDQAVSCAAKLNFKIEPTRGSIFKFSFQNYLAYVESCAYDENIDEIWKEVEEKFFSKKEALSKNIHKPHGRNQNEYLSQRLMNRFKRIFDEVGINQNSLQHSKI
jgi:hypothetical protein